MNFSHLNQKDIRKRYPHLRLDQYELFRALGKFFAQLVSAYGISVRKVQKLGYGTISAVLRVDADSGDFGKTFVIKISARDDLVSEAFFLEKASRLANVPRVLLADFSKQILPYDYLFLSFVPGTLPHTLKVPARERAGEKLGMALVHIHTIPVKGVGNISENAFAHSSRDWQKLLITSLRSTWRTVKKNERAFLPRYQTRVEKLLNAPVLGSFSPKLLHGDVGGNNYLVECDRLGRVRAAHCIDPGTWVGGDPMQDLAFSQISWNYPGFSEGFFRGYTKIHPLNTGEQERFRILHLYNQYWATMISRMRDRSRWKAMFDVFQKLLAEQK